MRCLHTGYSTLLSPWHSPTGSTAYSGRDQALVSHQAPIKLRQACRSPPTARQRRPCSAQPINRSQPCRSLPAVCRHNPCRSSRQLHRKQWLRRSASGKCCSTVCQAARAGTGPGPYGDWPPGAHWTDVSGDEEEGPALDSITSSEVDNHVPVPVSESAEAISQPPPDERIHHIQVPKQRPKLQAATDKAYSRHGGVLYPPAGAGTAAAVQLHALYGATPSQHNLVAYDPPDIQDTWKPRSGV